MNKIQIINDECVNWMRQQAPNTIDAIVTDPPYGLEFMGSEWDTFSVRLPREVLSARRFAHLTTVERLRREDVTNKAQLTLLVYQEWTRQWALEAIRVLKPGAYMLVMSGTRTVHRMTAGLEDAGFIIKDCLCWVYASGFPKSYNISKGFDKSAGVKRPVIGSKQYADGRDYAHEPTAEKEHIDTGLSLGTDKPRTLLVQDTVNVTPLARQWDGWGTALKPAWEPIVMVQKPLEGNYCENVERWGVGGLNIDATRVKYKEGEVDFNARQKQQADMSEHGWVGHVATPGTNIQTFKEAGRFPANVQVDSEGESLLDDIMRHKQGKPYLYKGKRYTVKGFIPDNSPNAPSNYNDSGSFDRFFIIPKASPSERGDANKHLTVKPIRLFKQLMKLVVPPKGTILDPFLGSGTACLAAYELGIACIGIEKRKDYCAIALERLKNYEQR